MTPREKMVVFETDEIVPKIKDEDALKILIENRIEKFPIVNSRNEILGLVSYKDLMRDKSRPHANIDKDGRLYVGAALISYKDLMRDKSRPHANIDKDGRLYVGAAIGAKDDYIDRAKALIDVGCDVLVVDIANGHNQLAIDAVQQLKDTF